MSSLSVYTDNEEDQTTIDEWVRVSLNLIDIHPNIFVEIIVEYRNDYD